MIHASADVYSDRIGEGTKIWQYSVILAGAKIGNNCNINCNCFIENDVEIGDNVTIKSGVYVWDGVRIADNVFIGPCVAFTNDLFPRSKHYPDSFVPTIIEAYSSIGANATIIAGTHIGEGAMIGAGSVVTCDVPAYTLWFGNPARFRSYICRCGRKLQQIECCTECGSTYVHDGKGLRVVSQ